MHVCLFGFLLFTPTDLTLLLTSHYIRYLQLSCVVSRPTACQASLRYWAIGVTTSTGFLSSLDLGVLGLLPPLACYCASFWFSSKLQPRGSTGASDVLTRWSTYSRFFQNSNQVALLPSPFQPLLSFLHWSFVQLRYSAALANFTFFNCLLNCRLTLYTKSYT